MKGPSATKADLSIRCKITLNLRLPCRAIVMASEKLYFHDILIMDMTSCTESCGFDCVIVYIKLQLTVVDA